MIRSNTVRGHKLAALVACLLAFAVVLTACSGNSQTSAQTAEKVMTRLAEATPGTPNPTSTPGPSPTPIPPVVYARCIVRTENEANMYLEPDDLTPITAQLANREIITAYGRTADAGWVLGWNAASTTGWVAAQTIGCTVPIEELRPTEPKILLTPIPGATQAAATQPTQPTQPAEPAETAETAGPPSPATETPSAAVVSPIATPEEARSEVEPSATLTPTAEVTSTVETTPTTAVGTVAVAEIKCVVTPGAPVNVRTGPSRTFRSLGTLRPGSAFNASGRNQDADWLFGATARGTEGWLIASSVKCEGDAANLPVAEQ
jgi:hypothetical protein